MKDGGRGVITVPHVVIYSTEEVSAEFDTPAVLPREQNPLICWLWESGGGGHRALLETLERGKIFISH